MVGNRPPVETGTGKRRNLYFVCFTGKHNSAKYRRVNSPTTRHWSQYTDLDLATSSSTTSRHTAGGDGSAPSAAAVSPTRNRICHVSRCGNSADGGGSSACFVRNDRTLVRNGPPEKPSAAGEGNARKSWKSAVALLFIRVNGFAPLLRTMLEVKNRRVEWLRRRVRWDLGEERVEGSGTSGGSVRSEGRRRARVGRERKYFRERKLVGVVCCVWMVWFDRRRWINQSDQFVWNKKKKIRNFFFFFKDVRKRENGVWLSGKWKWKWKKQGEIVKLKDSKS